MFDYRLKIERELLDKAKKAAQTAGYASVEEFLLHAIEKEITRVDGPQAESSDPEELIKRRLQGLGYIE